MRKGKILVVNSEVKMRKILEGFLYKKGFNVKSVNDGAKAIEILKDGEFDLVLCDCFMPHITRYDVVKFIKESGKRTKTGLLEGYDDLIGNKEREEMRVEFVIKKPFDFTELEECINEAINSRIEGD